MKSLFTILLFLAVCSALHSQKKCIYAINSGNWSNDSTWNLKRQPIDNDSIVIPLGITVILSTDKSLTNVVIDISGVLSIDEAIGSTNSNDLDITTTTNKITLVVLRLFDAYARIERGADNTGGGRIRVKINNSGNFITKYSTLNKTLSGTAVAHNNITPSFFRDLGGSLTVVLLEFSISNTDKKVALKWKSQQENNNEHYLVERSKDALTWQQISEVKAVANSTIPQQYSYTDVSPFNGINYYRLRVVNRDGKFGLTPVKAARISNSKNSISIYPNPATINATIFINEEDAKDFVVHIYSQSGQLMGQQKSTNGSNIMLLDVSRLIRGNYLVEVVGNNGYRQIMRLLVAPH